MINGGTIDYLWVEGIKKAVKTAQSKNIPWVLDPVGCGSTYLLLFIL